LRSIYRLSDTAVKGIVRRNVPGRWPDGGNLFFQIKNGGASFIMRYAVPGVKVKSRNGILKARIRELGLGSYTDTALADARERRDAARALLKDGKDPLADKASKRAVAAKAKSFGTYCEEFLADALAGFKNDKHRAQWGSTLRTYAKPIWTLAIHEITPLDVKACLDPIWLEKPETARRVRGRIERVLDAAKGAQLRDGSNPAAWQGNLKPMMAKQKTAKDHHAAVTPEDMPGFMRDLRKLDSISAAGLEFAILTAARTGEVRLARWDEIDLKEANWVIPAARMKSGKQHRVPLCARALAILKALKRGKPGDLVFANPTTRRELSDAALLECVRGLRAGVTTHGFRSSFKDWATGISDLANSDLLSEMALAHAIKDRTKAAYLRGDALEKRREMMTSWERYLAG
jgi:integrase